MGGRSALRAATWLVITLSHRCPPVPGPVRAGSHLRARVTEGELSLRGPPGGHTLAGGHARAARSPAGPRLALTGREPVSPRIISRGDVTGPRGRSLWGQVPDTPQVCATPQPRPAAPPSLRRAVTFLLLLLDPDTAWPGTCLLAPLRLPSGKARLRLELVFKKERFWFFGNEQGLGWSGSRYERPRGLEPSQGAVAPPSSPSLRWPRRLRPLSAGLARARARRAHFHRGPSERYGPASCQPGWTLRLH